MDCKDWLAERLGKRGTEMPCDLIREEAKAAGYTKAQLKAARRELGVKTFHWFESSKDTEVWFWFLPTKEE